MKIKDISLNDFNNFIKTNPLANHYQTINYALLMSERGYEHDIIGYVDEFNNIYAVTIILFKNINKKYKYGYAPKGFILDYFNEKLVNEFTKELINYYKKKHIIFIKINPEIAIKEITKTASINLPNIKIKKILEDNNYIKLKDNLYFESILPRYNAIISLKDFNLKDINKNTRNKINRALTKGLKLEVSNRSGLDILRPFIKRKKTCDEFYYKDYYNAFKKDEMIELLLVYVDPKEYLVKARKIYEDELEKNNKYNQELIKNNSKKNINKKMMSDKKLLSYKNDVYLATELNKQKEKKYIAGALVVKFQNRANILISGYDKKYKAFNPNYFLHYALIKHYQKNFDYLDLNGMTGDLSKNNPYHGLNEFKLGFNPKMYEFIGEFDLPIKPRIYQKLRKKGELAKLFNKPNLKEINN